MRRWHGLQAREVTPSLLREWVSVMDCTSKAIRNTLTPLRSIFEDALNDEIIEFNPFDRIALSKLIRQTAKASDYVVNPFTAAERDALLEACRPDERPMLQFWFATGLRPGELQALEWRHIDWERQAARIEQNQVAGVIKAPKTAAGIRDVDLDASAIAALKAQRPLSEAKGARIWLNPRDGTLWTTDAQIRKTLWLPVCTRSGVDYRNPYQVRHTYASTLLTAGHNPWYVAAQLGHEDVEMVFRTYGRFIREDYQKPKPELRIVGSR
jgi:integrase